MRRATGRWLVLVTLTVVVATCLSAGPAAAADSPAPKGGVEEFLFTVQSARGTTSPLQVTGPEDEKFRLALTGVDPVTMFSDRPFRDARLISASALNANWPAFFASDPPNAVLTYARPGRAPGSMVVTLTNPTYEASTRTLSFTAVREQRKHDPAEKGVDWQRLTTPRTLTSVSLFIDDASTRRCVGGPPIVQGTLRSCM